MRPTLDFSSVHLSKQRWYPLVRKLANLLRHFPHLTHFLISLYRLGRPRFSAGVTGVVFNAAGEVLLVEHAFHGSNPWGLPGGWVDRAEQLDEAIVRELQEELQLTVQAENVVHTQLSKGWRYHIHITFLCTPQGDVGELSPELLAFRWLPIEDLPDKMPSFQRQAILKASQLRSACLP